MNLGRHHPLLKRLRRLRRSAAARAEEGVLVAEGIHLAREALGSDRAVRLAVVDPRLAGHDDGNDLLREFEARGIETHEVASSVMDGLQDARAPQPVLVLVDAEGPDHDDWRAEPDPLVVVCDGIQDPGNLGSAMRSADAAGAALFWATGQSADATHPRTVRASMGSVFRLPVARGPLEAALDRLKAARLQIVGTVVRGGADYRDADYATGGCALLFGGEGSGLSRPVLERCDLQVTIPLRPGVESLSVGAAVAVMLFEAVRRRRR